MTFRSVKSLTVAVFSLFLVIISGKLLAQEANTNEATKIADTKNDKKAEFNAQEVIFDHILDNHEFHFTSYKDAEGKEHYVSIPLPVILYSPQKGISVFSSSKLEHGEAVYDGYKLEEGKVVAVNANNVIDETIKVYDISLTRNVVQMILALTLLTWLLLSIAKSYKSGVGVTSAPKGKQSFLEPVITFVRDEVAKPNLGHKYEKYLPYLLTIFFFILINNIFGLIPGTANVTGNIAFTCVLGVVSFVVIMFSSNKHYWGHIINPPGVPFLVKFILVPIEFTSVFIKPFALIIRLFANMVAGHIIIISLISVIFIVGQTSVVGGWGTAPFSVAFTVFIYFIEILVAFLQAFIFTMLTAVFIGQAFEGEHHEEAAHH